MTFEMIILKTTMSVYWFFKNLIKKIPYIRLLYEITVLNRTYAYTFACRIMARPSRNVFCEKLFSQYKLHCRRATIVVRFQWYSGRKSILNTDAIQSLESKILIIQVHHHRRDSYNSLYIHT